MIKLALMPESLDLVVIVYSYNNKNDRNDYINYLFSHAHACGNQIEPKYARLCQSYAISLNTISRVKAMVEDTIVNNEVSNYARLHKSLKRARSIGNTMASLRAP